MKPDELAYDFLTTRDYIAIEAMKSFITAYNHLEITMVLHQVKDRCTSNNPEYISQQSYKYADALIAESNKK